jgi:hypothetical protein
MAEVVDISRVGSLVDPSPYFVKKMKEVLVKQGQIEPLQVKRVELTPDLIFYKVFDQGWGKEILFAARALGWKTILIVEMERYER